MLTIKNLTKYYRDIKGVEDISLEIKKGEIFGFIGPNGAGKSTTIRCIMNIINRNNGQILLNGKEIDWQSKQEIGYLPSELHFYEDMTVKQIIEYSGSFYIKDCKNKSLELVNRLQLDLTKKVDELSLGNLKKLGIILTFMHDPKLIILDEPTSGLDPLMQEEFYKILKEEKEKGKTIFFSSHVLSEVRKICDRVAIIKDGSIIKIDKVEKLYTHSTLLVTLKCEAVQKLDINNIIFQEENLIKFIYNDDINSLISKLKGKKIERLLIEESFEDSFMQYYIGE